MALAIFLIPAGTAGTAKKSLGCTTIDSAPSGPNQTFKLHLCNDSTSPNQLGSANITAPSGFKITAVSPLPQGSGGTSTFDSGSITLRNLAIQPGAAPMDFTITADTPCAAGTVQWSIYAKQSNDFNGQPGNNFSPYPTMVNQTITGGCKLKFVNQPADTPVKFPIKDAKWGAVQTTTGNPLKVIVVAGDGTTRVSGTGTVSITGTGGTGCSSLTNNTTVPFTTDGSSNAAVFTNMTPTSTATGCTLTATSDGGAYLASDPTTPTYNVDPVKLFFVNQPTDTVVNTFIRDVKYGNTGSAGSAISVGVRVESQRDTSKLQFNGTGSVTIAISGTGCTLANSGTSESFVSGVATFASLKPTSVATSVPPLPPPCTLSATGSANPGYSASLASSAFNVVQYGQYCSDPNNCVISGSDPDANPNSSKNTVSGAKSLTLLYTSGNTSFIPDGASCKTDFEANYVDSQGKYPNLGLLFVDPVPGFSGTYSNTMVLTIDKHWVQANPQNGNGNMDICFGAQRIDKATGQPIDCHNDQNGVGWISHDGTPAACASDGNYWARIGDKNDNIPVYDPQITSITSDQKGNRIVTITLGDSTGLTWFWDLKWSP